MAEEKKEQKFEVVVKRVTKFNKSSNQRIGFTADVNGVEVSNLVYFEFQKDGKDSYGISMPQRKGTDKNGNDKYFNIVYFPVSEDLKKDIKKQIFDILAKA